MYPSFPSILCFKWALLLTVHPLLAVADSLAFGRFFHTVHQHSGVDKRMDSSSRSDRQMDVLIEYSVSSLYLWTE